MADIRYGDLDAGAVRRVALNEVRLADGGWAAAASRPLGETYLELYLSDPEGLAAPIAGEALAGLGAGGWWGEGRPGAAEFVAGRALALAALAHVSADLELAWDRFAERALEAVGAAVAGAAGEEPDDARLVGVDMRREVRSSQSMTPADVLGRFRELRDDGLIPEGSDLGPLGCEAVAEGFMGSMCGLQLDRADLDDVDSRIATALGLE